jgi:proline iminopeptidase
MTTGLATLSLGAISPAETQTTRPSSLAQSLVSPADRAGAAGVIANARRIVTPNGVERLQAVKIGGIDQWVSVRGADKRNPVLLLIHGGPGYISMPMSWWFSRGWEEYFTVVQWDQRGAGKTYMLNDPAKIAPTLTLDRMLKDTEEMLDWIRQELGPEKTFALGHSWGSYLGLQLAARHPERLHAYIGVGQVTNGPEGERRGWAYTLHAAETAGNQNAVRQLRALAPYFAPGKPSSLQDIYTQRKWLDFYGGVMAHRSAITDESYLTRLSPDYSEAEIRHVWDGNDFSEHYLLQEVLSLDLSNIQKLECPLIVFAGRYDVNINSQVAAEWFATVKAPSKQFVWFENSAHLPMTEQPGEFLISLVQYARPLAVNTA